MVTHVYGPNGQREERPGASVKIEPKIDLEMMLREAFRAGADWAMGPFGAMNSHLDVDAYVAKVLAKVP